MSDLAFLVVCGPDRAEAEDEASALRAAHQLRQDRFDALRTQGSRSVEVDIYWNDRHVLRIPATQAI